MRETRDIMGMPITIEVVYGERIESVGEQHSPDIDSAFQYFREVDVRFSTYKETSEISMINRGELSEQQYSPAMREVFMLATRTKGETDGYFDMQRPDGTIDPSGIVKGWAIHNAAHMLAEKGCENFFIDAGGDIAMAGKSPDGSDWSVGIRNPFRQDEIVKVIYPKGRGVATSGSYERGAHIYDPNHPERALDEIVSITVIGPDVLEADRFATAAFAMQRNGITFIEHLDGFEGYMIDKDGMATMTSGFDTLTRI